MKQKNRIDSSSVFVVSGGAKGITARCVVKLAQQYSCRWILLGRSELMDDEPVWAKQCFDEAELKRRIMQHFLTEGEKPKPVKVQKVFNKIRSSREISKTLASLKALGREVEYLSVDVADACSLKTQLIVATDRMGKISGIIHGAGNIADKWIENKTERDFENVYAAKVKGLENLLSCIPASQLDYLVLFSSVAGFFGSAGQSDYALANEILNKSAHLLKRKYPDCHTVAIGWGPWDSGMVTPELKKAFAQKNIEIIPIEIGTQMLIEEMRNENQETAQVVIGSPLTSQPEELDDELRSYRIRRRLSLEANPFLKDHAIGGNPVLPATCAAAWIISTCEQLYPGYQFSSLENFRVLKGIVFDNTQANEYFVDVREISKTSGSEAVFEVRIWSETAQGKIRFHYSAQVKLQSKIPGSPQYNYNSVKNSLNPILDGSSLYQNKILFHGLSFQGVDSVLEMNQDTLTMQCILPEIKAKQLGQFQVTNFNPYAGDVAIQSVLIWLRQLYQTSALPLEIQQITHFKTISFNQKFFVFMEIHLKTETHVIASTTVYDEQREVYMRLSGIRGSISSRLNHLFKG
jgi:NAD(P)-dependent dehydrogenase (short-subunit alcohol dehydrogenase family)